MTWYEERAEDDFLDLCRMHANDERNRPRPGKAQRKREDRGVLIDLVWRDERREREALRTKTKEAKQRQALRAHAEQRTGAPIETEGMDDELERLIMEQAIDASTTRVKYASGLPEWLTEDYE